MGSTSGKMFHWSPTLSEGEQLATFAAGCFWSVELMYQRVPGVRETAVGYVGGKVDNPRYEQVCSGDSGHAEAVQLVFNEKEVGFKELVDLFFKKHDPTTLNRQGADCGTQYRSAIFYHSEEQRRIAEEAKSRIPKAVTQIVPATTFWPAEEYHQQYLVAEISIQKMPSLTCPAGEGWPEWSYSVACKGLQGPDSLLWVTGKRCFICFRRSLFHVIDRILKHHNEHSGPSRDHEFRDQGRTLLHAGVCAGHSTLTSNWPEFVS